MLLSVLNISDRTLNWMTLMVEPVARVCIDKLVSRFPSVSTHKEKCYTVQKPHIGRCPSHRVFRDRQVSQAMAALRLG